MAVSGAVAESKPAMQMDRDANGRIPLAPLTGFGLVLVAESVRMLRLEFVRTREQQRHGTPDSIQLALTPAQARRLEGSRIPFLPPPMRDMRPARMRS